MITGASRGIDLCIAKRAARDGANVVICAKTVEAHPTLPGSIHEAVTEVERLGGKGLACVIDVRDEASIEAAVSEAVAKFGGIDILINCASAIFPTETSQIDLKRLNLMWEVTTRGPLLMAKHCVPHLKASAEAGRNPHVITCSPPVDFTFLPAPQNPNYLVCKMGMTVGTITLAEEIDDFFMGNARTPEIQSDAVYAIVTSDSSKFTGNQTIDEDVMIKAGVKDLSVYNYITLGKTPKERLKNILRC